jgi:hypothetical protein
MAGTLVRTWSLGPALTTDLDVVPDEVLSNIVRHGLRHGREHEICIPLAVEPDTVTLTAATSASRNGTASYSESGDRGQASPPREAPRAGAPHVLVSPSNRSPLALSPRPAPFRLPSHRSARPSNQRANWKARSMTAPSRGTSSSPVRLADLALERLDPGARQKRRERRSKWNVRLHPSDHRKTLRISTQFDQIQDWSLGGPSGLDNLQFCAKHDRLKAIQTDGSTVNRYLRC